MINNHALQTDPKIDGLLSSLNYMAENPPGDDQYAKGFYKATIGLLQNDARLIKLFGEVYKGRQIQNTHLVNLILRVTQARLMHRSDYPLEFNEEKWKVAIGEILEKDWEGFLADLLTKDTGTTIYRRSAGLKIVAGAMFYDHQVTEGLKIIDIGCGRNYALRGIALGISQGKIEGGSEEIRHWLERPVKIARGIAVDRVDYRTEEAKKWAMACGFRPAELRTLLPEVEELESKLEKAEGVEFHPMDFSDILGNGLHLVDLDIMMASTVLYQDPEGQHRLMQIAQEILHPEGVFMVQDFALRKPGSELLDFRDDWSTPFSYRTFVSGSISNWAWWEILQWKDGRCREVKEGEDFAQFKELAKMRGGV